MITKILDVVRILNRNNNFTITRMDFNRHRNTRHEVKHSFQEEIIVPIAAISDNIDFMMCDGEKEIITADKVRCKCVQYDEIHICEADADVNRIYGVDMWTFINRWYSFLKEMNSMNFIRMRLIKK